MLQLRWKDEMSIESWLMIAEAALFLDAAIIRADMRNCLRRVSKYWFG